MLWHSWGKNQLTMNSTLSNIDYKEYPEYMFAMIAAFLPDREGYHLRRVAGKVAFRSVDKHGNTYRNGLLHSFNDQPAINGYRQEWYKNGDLHRGGDLPAIVEGNLQEWYNDGKLHREGDRPAHHDDEVELWYFDGLLHREGDKPAVVVGEGRKEWYRNGKRHRDCERPAIIDGIYKEMYIEGKLIIGW